MKEPPGKKSAIVLHGNDDVAVLATPVQRGDAVLTQGAGDSVVLYPNACLAAGHKIALRTMPAQAEVRKYGEVIGRLTAAVKAGDHVHVHNLVSLRATASIHGSPTEERSMNAPQTTSF